MYATKYFSKLILGFNFSKFIIFLNCNASPKLLNKFKFIYLKENKFLGVTQCFFF